MKQWQRKIKLKPSWTIRSWRGLIPIHKGEEHQAELMDSIFRKEHYWPDRLIPLTEEEQAFKAECEANRPTFEQACKAFDEMHLRTWRQQQVVLATEKTLRAVKKWVDER